MKCNKNSNHQEVQLLASFLKVIAEENRLKIICFLQKNNEQCVCQIQAFLDLPQNLISHHLKVLKNFKLLNYRKDGLKNYYSINADILNKYQENLNNVLDKGEK